MNRVTIFGTGYVGLVTGACLADAGNQVLCMDVDTHKIDGLNKGVIPIFEPGLENLVNDGIASGRLKFTSDAATAVAHGEFILIAVGTPPDEDGSADLKHVLAVARTIGEHIDGYRIVVNKSTVPVGTADRVNETITEALAARGESVEFAVVSNPEFLKEGAAVEDCMKPDRIVLGTLDEHALTRMKALYAPFNRNHERIIAMDVRSAELTKYAANAMLATKISFMNEMANLAERVGADIELVRRGIGSDPRIGFSFIYPGAGYGGSCFPKDVQALERTARAQDYDMHILRAVETVNERQKSVVLNKIRRHFDHQLAGLTFALWGLSFKPNTDDMRDASSRVVMEGLWADGAGVRAYDPEATGEAERIYGERTDLTLCETADEALEGADALVVMTEWKSFWSPDFENIRKTLKNPLIFDGRNIYDPAELKSLGIDYYAIGRGL
jgi:UDPglucose 6-dehydrogenase